MEAEHLVGCENENPHNIKYVKMDACKSTCKAPSISTYLLGAELGTGNFGVVRLGIHVPTNEKVAIKILRKQSLSTAAETALQRELTSMENVHHPNLLRLYERIETPQKVCIAMEYAPGGTLSQLLHDNGRLEEQISKHVFAQLIAAMNHCHNKGISHRDLKATNILFGFNNVIKICDFGLSTQVPKDGRCNTFCGSPPYVPPEIFTGKPYSPFPVDAWALGVILYYMLTNTMPFSGRSSVELKKRITEVSYTMPNIIGSEPSRIIRKLLMHNPAKRISLTKLMCEPWFNEVDFLSEFEPRIPVLNDDVFMKLRLKLDTFGFPDRDHFLITALNGNEYCSITATYRILQHTFERVGSVSTSSSSRYLNSYLTNLSASDIASSVPWYYLFLPCLIRASKIEPF